MLSKNEFIIAGAMAYDDERRLCRVEGVRPMKGEIGRRIVMYLLLDANSSSTGTEFAIDEEEFRRLFTLLKIV